MDPHAVRSVAERGRGRFEARRHLHAALRCVTLSFMRRFCVLGAAIFALAVSCGGTVTEGDGQASTGGSAGTSGAAGTGGVAGKGGAAGTAGTASGGGTGGTVDPCAVPAAGTGPWETVFVFRNSSTKSSYLYEDCHVQMEVTACTSGYATPIARYGDCTSECSDVADGGGCMVCGQCMAAFVEVKPGQTHAVIWAGYRYTFDQVQGCPCHVTHISESGRHRISIPVWSAMTDPWSVPPPSATIVQDFAHGVDSTVTVEIGL